MQIVLFKLRDVHYGVDVDQVQGVVEVESITSIPNAPYYVEGVTNLRGDVIPVIDLRKKFNLPARGQTEDYKMIVVRCDTNAVGVLVDTVMVVMDLAKDDIGDIPDLISSVDDDAMIGVAKEKEDLIVLLDLIKVVGAVDLSDFASGHIDTGVQTEIAIAAPD